jgi:hypothetical protein
MIGYDELVEALAAWRSRQGLAETGSDYLGPPAPFPVYRVEHPTQSRSYAGEAEEIGEGEVLYAEDSEATEFAEAAEISYEQETVDASDLEVESYEAEGDQAESYQAEGDQAESDQAEGDEAESYQAEGDQAEGDQAESYQAEGDQAESYQAEYAGYDDQTDANVDAAALAQGDYAAPVAEMVGDETADVAAEDYLDEEEYAESMVVDGASGDETTEAAGDETVASDVPLEVATEMVADEPGDDAAPEMEVYAAEEHTAMGMAADYLAPGENRVAGDLEGDLDNVELDEGDSVSYDDDDKVE